MKEKMVVYGTSDHLLNFAEVLLTKWVSEKYNLKPIFFYYPKGLEWYQYEANLFEPYSPPKSFNPNEAVKEIFEEDEIQFFPLQDMIDEVDEVANLKLKEIVEVIRKHRDNKSFVVVNQFENKKIRKVYCSSKDNLWKRKYKDITLKELLKNTNVKIGGTLIYFLYGAYLSKRSNIVGILPKKIKDDVLRAFYAGEKFVGKKAKIVETGEFDVMTKIQWQMFMEDRKWRKAPSWVIRELVKDDNFCEKIKDLLLEKKEYTPVAYDVYYRMFFLWNPY